MSAQAPTYRPGRGRELIAPDGSSVAIPDGYELLPPGDAMLTRRVKAAGPHYAVAEKVGRKLFSRGVYAPGETIRAQTALCAIEREDPAYLRKLEAGREKREREQAAYVLEFRAAVHAFLAFHPRHKELSDALADAVTAHAVPVGSGTVARTERIPLERRAGSAVFAWLRHQTTRYDRMKVARVKGLRREIRRELADESRALLLHYRRGDPVDPATCPLRRALSPPPVI